MLTEADASRGAPDWQQELEQRLALATPNDTVRGLFFNSLLGLVRTLGDEATLARCLEASGQQRFLDFFNYPVSALLRLTYTAGNELAPRYGGFDGAMRRMGHQAMGDFLDSLMGRALRHLAGQDTRTLMSNIQNIYRMTLSYGTRQLVWDGPKRGRLILQRNFLPAAYHEGGLRMTLDQMKARNVSVVGRRTGPLDSEYEFTWE
ncbi:MAG TPA: TIGR02265 family protein [Archangium sp.]|nr:TIGR02265 family protein [Archangium sp.]